jgi:hypothetical protein
MRHKIKTDKVLIINNIERMEGFKTLHSLLSVI